MWRRFVDPSPQSLYRSLPAISYGERLLTGKTSLSPTQLKIDQRVFVTPSKRKLDVNVVQSNYHIELTPRYAPHPLFHQISHSISPAHVDWRMGWDGTGSDVGIYDRVVIQDILKEIAQTQQVDLNAKQKFKGTSPALFQACFLKRDLTRITDIPPIPQSSSSTKPTHSPEMPKPRSVGRWRNTRPISGSSCAPTLLARSSALSGVDVCS